MNVGITFAPLVPTYILWAAAALAVVLAGIGLGGLAASAWLARDPSASRHAAAVALLAGASCVATYALFDDVLVWLGFSYVIDVGSVIVRAAFLMLGVSFASGVLFTLLAAALDCWRASILPIPSRISTRSTRNGFRRTSNQGLPGSTQRRCRYGGLMRGAELARRACSTR